ncbi:hypothetical protein FSW04_15745 [Baekduia soli]|uniref:Uncharacterized protein n=1 Tax=Baekduia soli TaxID=496014 RepID=A0A5B8U882_9ACTN|nr:hypothetical protein [Baekduia soli]QEC48882.1 hypothetical protein FSW04_15745 [Baekduia soli]
MRRLPLALALAALLPGAIAGAAGAATWSAPQTVSQVPHTFAGPLGTTVAGDGSLLAFWPWQDGLGAQATVGAAIADRPELPGFGPGQPPTSAFGLELRAPATLLDVAADGRSRMLALAQVPAGGSGPGGARRVRLQISAGTVAGGFGAPRTLVTGAVVYRPQLAVGADGTALVAWIEITRTAAGAVRRVVRVAERRPGGRFGAPSTLSGRGRADTLAVAVSGRGDEAVAFVREGRLLARLRRHGHGWGSVAGLARADGATTWELTAAADARGQMRVVWRRHQRSRSGVAARRSLEGTWAPVGRFTFRPAQVLEPDGVRETSLAPTPGGWPVAYAVDTPAGARPVLRVTPAGQGFGAPRYPARAQSGLRDVVLTWSPVGGIVVAWVQPVAGQDGDGLVRAAADDAGVPDAPFGPVEDASPAEAAHEVRLGADGRAGQPVAVWTARPQGTGPGIPTADVHTVVRSAVRLP